MTRRQGAASSSVPATAMQQILVIFGDGANRAPMMGMAIADQMVDAGSYVMVDVSGAFSDADMDMLTYSAESDMMDYATVSVDGSMVTITGVAAGTATITVTAMDPDGATAMQEIMVTVNPENMAPMASEEGIADQMVDAGSYVMVDVSGAFSDADMDMLTYSAESDMMDYATVSVDGSMVTITGVAAGTATITVTAMDPDGATAMQEIMVTVNPENMAPMASEEGIADQMVDAGSYVMVDVSGAFSDADMDMLTYSAESDMMDYATVSVDGSMVTITGVAAGTATITVTAMDPDGATAMQEIMVTVNPENMAPMASEEGIADQMVDAGSYVMVDVSGAFSDADMDMLTYSAESDMMDYATVSVDGSMVTITGVAAGTATITVTAMDPDGATAMQKSWSRS